MRLRLSPVIGLIWLGIALASAGCAPMRFVVEAAPATEGLSETVVDESAAGGGIGWSTPKVALIEFTGLIADAQTPGLLSPGENPVARFGESLRRAEKDHNVRAVIVRINSPGGTVTASDLMYRELLRFKEKTKKPVVVHMADVAASGAYYASCAADEIIASPTTITGSIGVIMQTFNFSDGMKKIGIRADAITSGPNKAVGSPFEPMPAEHRELLQNLVMEFYSNFREVVTTNRSNLSPADIDIATDGRVVSGMRAAEIGLVDSTGDLHDAFAAAMRRANLSRAKLVKYHRKLEYVGSPYATSPIAGAGANAGVGTQINLMQVNLANGVGGVGGGSGFLYLWDPSVPW